MEIFRLSKEKYADKLSGIGASLKGARWNSIGTEVIYCASSRALAMSEVLVHASLQRLPDDLQMLTILVPDDVKPMVISESSLRSGWRAFPYLSTFQHIGDDFVREGKSCLLKIPSVVVDKDWNYLINPKHKDFSRIKIVEKSRFKFDRRLGR